MRTSSGPGTGFSTSTRCNTSGPPNSCTAMACMGALSCSGGISFYPITRSGAVFRTARLFIHVCARAPGCAARARRHRERYAGLRPRSAPGGWSELHAEADAEAEVMIAAAIEAGVEFVDFDRL